VDATSAIECDGKYVKGYHRRAQARTNSGQFESALEDFEHVVRANPESKTLQAEVNACMQKAAEVMLGGMDLGSLNLGGDTGGAQRKPVAIQEDSDDSDDDDEAVDGVGDAPPPSNPRVDDGPTAAFVDGTQDGTGDAVPNKPVRKSVPIVEEDSSDDEDEETSHEQVSLTPAMDPAEAAETCEGPRERIVQTRRLQSGGGCVHRCYIARPDFGAVSRQPSGDSVKTRRSRQRPRRRHRRARHRPKPHQG
jgi:hypothetical protein